MLDVHMLGVWREGSFAVFFSSFLPSFSEKMLMKNACSKWVWNRGAFVIFKTSALEIPQAEGERREKNTFDILPHVLSSCTVQWATVGEVRRFYPRKSFVFPWDDDNHRMKRFFRQNCPIFRPVVNTKNVWPKGLRSLRLYEFVVSAPPRFFSTEVMPQIPFFFPAT